MTSKAETLISLFGGPAKLAEALSVDRAVISRWPSDGPRGKNGYVPPNYNMAILKAAKKFNIDASAVEKCLDQNTCPCCGQELQGLIDWGKLPNPIRNFVMNGVVRGRKR